MAGRTLVLAPVVEPVSLDEATLFARVTSTAEDQLVLDLITAARKRCEDWRGQSFVTQTWDYFLDAFPVGGVALLAGFTPIGALPIPTARGQLPITLPRPPLQSVTWVKYTPYNAATLTMDPATYQVDVSNTLAPRVQPNYDRMWPTDVLQSVNGVNIRFIAGYVPVVPEQIQLAIKQCVAYWYYNRDAVGVLPPGIDATLAEVTGGFTYA